jgi:single-strand DNA-binding protein
MYLNKAFVFGNLTRDPEVRALPSGIKVASFSLATNRVYKDKEGRKQESAEYHNVVVFGKQAETVAQYIKKGASLFVEGRMQTRSWDGPDGQKKYRTEIVADRVQFGPRTGGGSASASTAPSKSASNSKPEVPEDLGGDAIAYPEEEINADDIPF